MNRIKVVSKLFKILFQIVFIIIPLIAAIGWTKAPEPIYLINTPSKVTGFNVIPNTYSHQNVNGGILHTLSATEKLEGFLLNLLPMSIELFILYSLIRLFQLYEQGEIFTINNVKLIRNIGYGLLIGQLVERIYEGLLGLVLTWHNPHGARYAAISFDGTNIGVLLTALLIILISWIMTEACQLQQEQQLTI